MEKMEKVTDTSSLNSCEKYTYFCRLCAKFNLSSDGIKIEDKQSKVLRKISTCLPIIVEKNDNLPKIICSNCSNNLNSFYDFYKRTIHADKKLNHFFNTQLIDETNPTKDEISKKSEKTRCLYCKVNVLNYDKHLKKCHRKQLSVQIYSLQTKESVFSRKVLAIIKNQSKTSRIKKKGKSAVKRQCTKCPFCQKVVFKFTRHLLLSHRNKEEVKIFLEYPKKDKVTISDFIKSLKEKIVFEPEIIIKTEPLELDNDESFEYTPTKKEVTCKKCSGIYSSRALNFHQRKCKGIKKCKTEIIDGSKSNEILPSNKRKLGDSRNPFSSTEDMINKECEKYLENYEEHLKCSTIHTNVATSYKTAQNITLINSIETNSQENIEKVIEPKKRGRKPKLKDPNSLSGPLNLTNKTTASVSLSNCEDEAIKLFNITDNSGKRIKTDGEMQREDLNVDPTKCGAILNIPQRKCRESVDGRFSYFHNTESLTSGILERKNFNSRKSIEDFRQLMIDHFLSLDDEPDLSPELDQDDTEGQPRRTYSVKRTWTDEEKSIMIKHFNSYIQSKTLPSFHLCGVVRDANPVLFGRTNSVMKAWVYNQYKKLK